MECYRSPNQNPSADGRRLRLTVPRASGVAGPLGILTNNWGLRLHVQSVQDVEHGTPVDLRRAGRTERACTRRCCSSLRPWMLPGSPGCRSVPRQSPGKNRQDDHKCVRPSSPPSFPISPLRRPPVQSWQATFIVAAAFVQGQGTCRKLGLLRAWFYAPSLTRSPAGRDRLSSEAPGRRRTPTAARV
jgi:hypothetical protein